MPIKTYQLNSVSRRAACAAVVIVVAIAVFSVAKWGFAHTAAVQSDTVEIAALAANLAPDDPQTHYSFAVLSENTFAAEDMQRAVGEYELAASRSPNNYLLWLDLSRARERNGDQPGAERALRKALELGPNYSRVQWALGNVLLRQGKSDEAFAEIRKALAGDANYTNTAATMAWQIFEGDVTAVRNAIGDSAQANASLATMLTGQKRFDEAFDIWDRLPADEKKTTLKENGQILYRKFLESGKYRLASRIGEQTGLSSNLRDTIGEVFNGGFEGPMAALDPNEFSWRIAEGTTPRIGPTDGQKHGGTYSLLMSFGQAARAIRQVSQTIAVEPGKNYVLELYYRSDLKTQSKIKWEIVAAANGKAIASTDALIPVTDWTATRTGFTVPEDIDGVALRFVAEGCDPATCSISGNIWFDDFSLKAVN